MNKFFALVTFGMIYLSCGMVFSQEGYYSGRYKSSLGRTAEFDLGSVAMGGSKDSVLEFRQNKIYFTSRMNNPIISEKLQNAIEIGIRKSYFSFLDDGEREEKRMNEVIIKPSLGLNVFNKLKLDGQAVFQFQPQLGIEFLHSEFLLQAIYRTRFRFGITRIKAGGYYEIIGDSKKLRPSISLDIRSHYIDLKFHLNRMYYFRYIFESKKNLGLPFGREMEKIFYVGAFVKMDRFRTEIDQGLVENYSFLEKKTNTNIQLFVGLKPRFDFEVQFGFGKMLQPQLYSGIDTDNVSNLFSGNSVFSYHLQLKYLILSKSK